MKIQPAKQFEVQLWLLLGLVILNLKFYSRSLCFLRVGLNLDECKVLSYLANIEHRMELPKGSCKNEGLGDTSNDKQSCLVGIFFPVRKMGMWKKKEFL